MKKIFLSFSIFFILFITLANADWMFNPYTKKMDYYESVGTEGPVGPAVPLIDSFASTTVLSAPTASALKAAYDALAASKQADLGYTSRSTDSNLGTSDVVSPSQKAIKSYVDEHVVGAVSGITGTNTGDETQAPIKTKLGAATNSADGYLTAADRAMFHGGLLARWAELGGALPITSCPPTQQILDAAAAMGFDQNHIFCVVFPVGGLITGTPSSYFLGSLTASGGGTATPTGSALTQVLGSLTALAYSNWYATPSGIGSQYVIGGLAGHGSGTATLIGFAQTGQLGTVIGSSPSSGNVAIFGVEQNIVLGSLVGHGDGNRTLTGITQSEVMGSVTGSTGGGGTPGAITGIRSERGTIDCTSYTLGQLFNVGDTVGVIQSGASGAILTVASTTSYCDGVCGVNETQCTDDYYSTWLPGGIITFTINNGGTGYTVSATTPRELSIISSTYGVPGAIYITSVSP